MNTEDTRLLITKDFNCVMLTRCAAVCKEWRRYFKRKSKANHTVFEHYMNLCGGSWGQPYLFLRDFLDNDLREYVVGHFRYAQFVMAQMFSYAILIKANHDALMSDLGTLDQHEHFAKKLSEYLGVRFSLL